MLNPKYQRYAERLKELIEEGQAVAGLERKDVGDAWPYIHEYDRLDEWYTKVMNIISVTFGNESQHFRMYQKLIEEWGGYKFMTDSHNVVAIVGLLRGALSDLEGGFLIGQEFLVAGEVFDSVLEEAKYLNDNGHKDASAVLGRVVIEDALRRIARQENVDDTQKPSKINDDLLKANRYAKPQWRLIQTWLDIGNSAAHGKFNEYDSEKVKSMLEGIGAFLAQEFQIG